MIAYKESFGITTVVYILKKTLFFTFTEIHREVTELHRENVPESFCQVKRWAMIPFSI